MSDIRDISHFPSANVLIGCYPCTGFSLASRRRWKNRGPRDLTKNPTNFLFKEYLRALKQVNPKYLFVENVGGMASANGGWFFSEQVHELEELGYSIHYKILDASHFGVPQIRKRLFLVGIKGGEDIEYLFPDPTHGPGTSKSINSMHGAIGRMKEWPEGEFFDYSFHGHYLTRQRKRGWNDPSYTIVANGHHVPLHPSGTPMKFVSKDKWKLQGKLNRRLSWRECARLQSLPGAAKPSGTLMDKYRVIGNSVPPPLAKALVSSVIQIL